MQNQNLSYEIVNQGCFNRPAQQYHSQQTQNVMNCVLKLKEFLDVADSVSPEYEDVAVMQCIGLMEDYYRRHGKRLRV
ncbi:MAG: hypothetical protein IJ282_02370 [Lachnospiraceae bacterium]|nr:hypothetical protein [Lachnospiraceae bacterium]